MTSILFLIEPIFATFSDAIILETKNIFWIFLCIFEIYIELWTF